MTLNNMKQFRTVSLVLALSMALVGVTPAMSWAYISTTPMPTGTFTPISELELGEEDPLSAPGEPNQNPGTPEGPLGEQPPIEDDNKIILQQGETLPEDAKIITTEYYVMNNEFYVGHFVSQGSPENTTYKTYYETISESTAENYQILGEPIFLHVPWDELTVVGKIIKLNEVPILEGEKITNSVEVDTNGNGTADIFVQYDIKTGEIVLILDLTL